MGLLGDDVPHCKRCGFELEGSEEECPQCEFNPKMKGLQVALSFLLVMVVAVSLSMFAPTVLPAAGPILVAIAAIAFPLAIVTLLFSFVVSPYRFAALFARL